MPDDTFSDSLATGPHALLGALAGDWAGTTRTWFMPGELADESEATGSVRAVLGGRFVVHEYAGSLGDDSIEGRATLGFDLPRDRFVCSWIDSFHTGTAVLLSEGEPGASDAISVLTSYGDDAAPWGWRTTFARPSTDELVVSHFNIPAVVEEYLAVETRYRRRS